MAYERISLDVLQKELNDDVREWQKARGLDKNFHPIKDAMRKKPHRVSRGHYITTRLLPKRC